MAIIEDEEGGIGSVSNRDVAKSAGTTLLARLGGVLDVLTQPLYVWLFGLASYGLYGALWAAINLAENVSDFGMTAALQRIVPQAKTPQEEASALRAAFLFALIPCIIVAAMGSLLAAPVATFFNASEADSGNVVRAVQLFAWALPLWAFVEISTSALRSKRLFGAEIRLRLLWEQVLRLGLIVIFYVIGAGMMALVYAHLLSLSLICILCVRLLTRHFTLKLMFEGPLRDAIFAETLKAGLGVLPVNIVTRLLTDGPALALNAVLPGSSGAVAASLFIIARKISSIVQLVRTIFSYVLAPLASAASTGGKDKVANIYGFATRISLALALPLGAVLAAMGPVLLRGFGTGAAAALTALIVLILARVIEAVVGAATPIQQVTSAHLDQMLGSLVGVAVAAVIAWGFVPDYGLNAMAVAVAVGLVIAALLPLFQLHIIDKLHPFAAPFGSVAGRTVLVTAAGACIVLAIQQLPFLGTGEVASNFITFLILLPLLVATLWASLRYALSEEDRAALGSKTIKRFRLG